MAQNRQIPVLSPLRFCQLSIIAFFAITPCFFQYSVEAEASPRERVGSLCFERNRGRSQTRVAIIGGGVSGLVVARHVAAKPENYKLTLFEQAGQIGGTWTYTNDTETDKNGLPVHSSMYKNLRTNSPKEIMQLPDFPFREQGGPSFLHHSAIKEYLLDYAEHFNLFEHIKLNAHVFSVEPKTLDDGKTIWNVIFRDMVSKVASAEMFDVVVICNGHYTVGNIPRIAGSETFPGDIIHSHKYRTPEKYTGKKVCILGASWSGIDIAMEISQYAERIYLSYNSPKPTTSKIADNVDERPGISSISGKTIKFRDGSLADVDAIIYCTGYHFSYPFLSEKVELYTKDNNVEPIYKHLVHTEYPSLFFIGLPAVAVHFQMVHIQAQYMLGVLEGRVRLPPSEMMREDFMREKKALLDQGIPVRQQNTLKDRQWPYFDEIAKAANVSSVPPILKSIKAHVNQQLSANFRKYKNYQYRIIDKDHFSACIVVPS